MRELTKDMILSLNIYICPKAIKYIKRSKRKSISLLKAFKLLENKGRYSWFSALFDNLKLNSFEMAKKIAENKKELSVLKELDGCCKEQSSQSCHIFHCICPPARQWIIRRLEKYEREKNEKL